jgi:type I restriction-modification system DNA methylase subunit
MLTEHHKKFGKALDSFDYSKRTYEKFYEFCKVSAYSLGAVFYPEIAKKELEPVKLLEDKKKLTAYEECFEILVDALETKHQDFLGVFFGLNELGNARNGQFFTPYNISLMCAKIQISGYEEIIKQKGFVKVGEPACGSGGMIIAVREVLLENGFNPSTNLYAELTDVDELCFLMAYIQISLYGIPAKVIHGNTLTMKTYRELFTPVFYINQFDHRLAISELFESGIFSRDPGIEQNIILEPIQQEDGQYRMAL